MVHLTAAFPTRAAANAAVAQMREKSATGPFNGGMSFGLFESIVLSNAGTPLGTMGSNGWSSGGYGSTSMRERFLYQYQARIHDLDLIHLEERDPVTWAINHKPPQHAWFRPPITNVPAIDDFFLRLRRLGFFQKCEVAHAYARHMRYSFLYINAGGDMGEPIDGVGAAWHGFQVIYPKDINWLETEYDEEDESLRRIYQIKRLAIRASTGATQKIHSSRLIAFVEDQEADHPTKARPKIAVCYDSIWNRRDYEFMRKQAQVEGNPIVITIDTDDPAGVGRRNLTDEEAEEMQAEVHERRSGSRDAIGPNENVNMTRLGAPDLDDPEWGIRMTTASIAVCQEFTVNMLMTFSRGSEQITDNDRNDYAANINVLRETFVWPKLDEAVMLGRESGFLGSKRGVSMPLDVDWPPISLLPQREDAFVLARHAATLQAVQPLGYLPPPRVMRQFHKDPNFTPPQPAPQNRNVQTPKVKARTPEEDDKEWKEYSDDVKGEPDIEKRKRKDPES